MRSGLNNAAAFLLGVGIAIVGVLASFLVAAGIGVRRQVLRPVALLAEEVREVVSGNVQRAIRADRPREILRPTRRGRRRVRHRRSAQGPR
jgi:hypothetical protein